MKVVFLESIEGTAVVGDVKEVKNGFARNYLLPRGLAAPAKEPYLERARAGAVREARKQEALDKDATAIAERLEGEKITMIARVGEQGKLYGSITSVHIAEEVTKLIGHEEPFDHRKVLLPEAIKEVGVQPVRLRFTRNVEAAIEVEVIAEDLEEDDIPIDPDADATGDGPAEASDTEAAEAELTSDDDSSADGAEEGSEEPKAEASADAEVEDASSLEDTESPADTDADAEDSDEAEAADEESATA